MIFYFFPFSKSIKFNWTRLNHRIIYHIQFQIILLLFHGECHVELVHHIFCGMLSNFDSVMYQGMTKMSGQMYSFASCIQKYAEEKNKLNE